MSIDEQKEDKPQFPTLVGSVIGFLFTPYNFPNAFGGWSSGYIGESIDPESLKGRANGD